MCVVRVRIDPYPLIMTGCTTVPGNGNENGI